MGKNRNVQSREKFANLLSFAEIWVGVIPRLDFEFTIRYSSKSTKYSVLEEKYVCLQNLTNLKQNIGIFHSSNPG